MEGRSGVQFPKATVAPSLPQLGHSANPLLIAILLLFGMILYGLVWFGYDYRAMIRGPFLRLFNDTPQSMSTSIGLTSGVGTSLKNLTYSCKYSAGETLKVWFARGVIAIASEGNAPNYQFAQWC